MTSESHNALVHALGALVLDAGRVEAWLVIATLLNEGDVSVERLRQVAKLQASQVLRELRGSEANLPSDVDDALKRLVGEDGLLERRNRLIHAIWRIADDGNVTGANLRAAVAVSSALEDLTLAEVEETRRGLSAVADVLKFWVAPDEEV